MFRIRKRPFAVQILEMSRNYSQGRTRLPLLTQLYPCELFAEKQEGVGNCNFSALLAPPVPLCVSSYL